MKKVLSCLFIGSLMALPGGYASSDDDSVFESSSDDSFTADTRVYQNLGQMAEGTLSYLELKDTEDFELGSVVAGMEIVNRSQFLQASLKAMLDVAWGLGNYREDMQNLRKVLKEISSFVKQASVKPKLNDIVQLKQVSKNYTKIRKLLHKFSKACQRVRYGGSVDATFVKEITDLIQK